MNLAQLYSKCNGNSGYSRSDGEIYSAINDWGFYVYSQVVKEQGGFFLKFDEITLTLSTLAANPTQEYAMPADLSQLVHLAERVTASENWHPMSPESLDSALTQVQDMVGWGSYSALYGDQSAFGYYGPYLDAAAAQQAQALEIQKIRVSPAPTQTRFVQIAYTAKWLPIVDASSAIMLPDEGTMAVAAFASAELCGMSDDVTRKASFKEDGQQQLTAFLSWVRMRQIQTGPIVQSYGPGCP